MLYIGVYGSLLTIKTRNQDFFWGRGVFLGLGHCNKQSCTTRERKVRREKSPVFSTGNS